MRGDQKLLVKKVSKSLYLLVGSVVLCTATPSAASAISLAAPPSSTGQAAEFVLTRVVDGKPTFSIVDAATARVLLLRGETVTSNVPVKLSEFAEEPYAEEPYAEDDYSPSPFSWMGNLAAVGLSTVVAVIDTGVDPSHPHLRDSILPGANFVPYDGVTAVAWSDGNGHGTHVAGVVLFNNPFAKILPVRVLDREGDGDIAPVAQGIVWAVDNGAQVLNISLGLQTVNASDLVPLQAAVQYAKEHDVVVVAAAGNEAEFGSPPAAPALFDEVIAVAATQNSTVAPFSNRSSYVDIATDGVDVLSSALGGGMVRMSGTSMASPRVAAIAAGLRALNPTWTASDIRDHLLSTADDRGALGPDPVYGFGEMNAYRVFSTALSRPTGQMAPPLPTVVKVKPAVGGSTITSRQGDVFVEYANGDIEVLSSDYSFVSLARATTVQIWTYDKFGAPTRKLTKRLSPTKLPVIKASAWFYGSTARLKITSKLPPDALLAVSTVSRGGIEKEVALLYPAVKTIAVPSASIRWFKVCYAVEARTLGCKKFRLP
jgi:subtilisin family serine protease